MAETKTTPPPGPGNLPLPTVFEVHCNAGLAVEPDHEHGVLAIVLAPESRACAILAPETALDLALRLIHAVTALRRPPERRP